MKSTKTTGKRRAAAKDVVSAATAAVAWRDLNEIFRTPNGDRWFTLLHAILLLHREEALSRDDEMARQTNTGAGGGQLQSVLGEILALRRFSTAQLFELGSSEEAMQLCREALTRGLREPVGGGAVVIRFQRRHRWTGDPLPEEAPPAVEPEK